MPRTARDHMRDLIGSGIDDRKELIERTRKNAGVSERRAQKIAQELLGYSNSHNGAGRARSGNPAVTVSQGRGMNRAEFLSRFDDNTRIREALKIGLNTLKGDTPEDDEILPDSEFRISRCEISNAMGFRQIAQEYAQHQFKVSDKVFWTTERNREWALRNVSRAREV